MKKFLSSLIVMLIVTFSANICAARHYNVYDYDPNYVWVFTQGSGGFSTYLYLPSIDVQEYNPPHYQIAGNFVTIGGKETSEVWGIFVLRFNWYTKETFWRDNYGNWQKEDVNGSFGKDWRRRADALFRAAYGIDFYGY